MKIEKQSDGKTTIIWLIGRIQGEDLDEIKKQIDDSSEQTVLDLGEVMIVDADVIQFLNARELGEPHWWGVRFIYASGFCASEPKGQISNACRAPDEIRTLMPTYPLDPRP